MKEQAITNEIKKMKKKFQDNNYNIKEIILFLEAKTKIAILPFVHLCVSFILTSPEFFLIIS